MPSARALAILALKIAVSVALLAWIFRPGKLHWSELAWARGGVDGTLVVAGLAVAGLYLVLSALRFGIVLRAFGLPCPPGHVFAIVLISHAFSFVSLGPVAGTASRIAMVMHDHPERKAAATLAVLGDHVVGSFAAGLAGVIALVWRWHDLAPHPVLGQPYVLAAGLVVGLVAMVFPVVVVHLLGRPAGPDRADGDSPGRIRHWQAMAGRMRAEPAALILGSLVSLPLLLAYFGTFVAGAAMVRAPVRVADILTALPAVDLVASLPVSLAGLGVREKAFQSILAALGGTSAADAVSLSLAGFSLLAAWAVAGVACLPWHHRLAADPPRPGRSA